MFICCRKLSIIDCYTDQLEHSKSRLLATIFTFLIHFDKLTQINYFPQRLLKISKAVNLFFLVLQKAISLRTKLDNFLSGWPLPNFRKCTTSSRAKKTLPFLKNQEWVFRMNCVLFIFSGRCWSICIFLFSTLLFSIFLFFVRFTYFAIFWAAFEAKIVSTLPRLGTEIQMTFKLFDSYAGKTILPREKHRHFNFFIAIQ